MGKSLSPSDDLSTHIQILLIGVKWYSNSGKTKLGVPIVCLNHLYLEKYWF